MISLENVTKDYGSVKALKNLTLQIPGGSEVVIMGPSGSGKTTLINLLAGLDSPSSGNIFINELEITDLSPEDKARVRRESIGIVFQQFHLIEYLTAVENVMLAQYFHSLPDKTEAREALQKVGLQNRADHLPGQLSGGEQQRVAIARAITNNPQLILADEPTGNLDEENEYKIMDIFHRLKQEGHTVITVTHNPDLADRCDYVYELDHGRLKKESIPA